MTYILAIETSCDETSVAIVKNGSEVCANVVSSQIDIHAAFGGVVPEIASRAHLDILEVVLQSAFDQSGLSPSDIDAVAATHGPGLVGALLVGVSSAKALALAWNVPYVEINHMEGHLFAAKLQDPDLKLPAVMLLVSGGHTLIVGVRRFGSYEILGSTIDDAAGEAFDKVARYLGLGYPGGPVIDRLAGDGNPNAIAFPRAMTGARDFSFSGLKTAVVNYVRANPNVVDADVAASFQQAVVDVLVDKTLAAADAFGAVTVGLGGGVAANSLLRREFHRQGSDAGRSVLLPDRQFCTDNAAMIGAAAYWRLLHDGPTALGGGVDPSLQLTLAGSDGAR